MKLGIEKGMSEVTKKVIQDFNTLSDQDFMNKYTVDKIKYAKRVLKYGDPYMNAPLAKFGKLLIKLFHH